MKINIVISLVISFVLQKAIAQIPTVNSFSPSTAWAGEIVEISGENLDLVTGVEVGSVSCLIMHQENNLLSFIVSPNTSSSQISLLYPMGSVSSGGNLTINDLNIYETPSRMVSKVDTPGGEVLATSADGSTVAIGIPDINRVSIFIRDGDSFSLDTALLSNFRFGHSISLSASGNTLVIGAPTADGGRGRIHIFNRVGSLWEEAFVDTPLTVTPSTSLGWPINFGTQVALSADGNVLSVSAPFDATGVGEIYIYNLTELGWVQLPGSIQGSDVTVDMAVQGLRVLLLNNTGSRLVFGGNDNGTRGAVWVFTNDGMGWNQVQKIESPDPTVSGFASSLSSGAMNFDGSFLFIGAISSNMGLGANQGATIVYQWNGTQYTYRQRLNSSDGFSNYYFGRAVSTNADGSLVAIGENNPAYTEGRVRVFYNSSLETEDWVEQPIPLHFVPEIEGFNQEDGQGMSVAMAANSRCLIMGSPFAQEGFYLYEASPEPIVNSFSPQIGTSNTRVVISGENLETIYEVLFNDIQANGVEYLPNGDAWFMVPQSTNGIGNFIVRTKGGEVTLSDFTYVEPPLIESFSPTTGGPGTEVSIIGQNLLYTDSVQVAGFEVENLIIHSDTHITFTIANGGTGSIHLITQVGEVNTIDNFNFETPQPIITSFEPTSASAFETVVIEGSNLFWVDEIHFGETPAHSFSFTAEGTIEAIVGYGNTGDITLESEGGIHSVSGFEYIPPIPTLYAVSPLSASVGSVITILGENLAATSMVYVNGTPALVLERNNERVKALIMPGTTSGSVAIFAGGEVSNAIEGFEVVSTSLPNQQQGSLIVGTSPVIDTNTGTKIVSSVDGRVVVLAAPHDDTYGLNAGSLRVFSRLQSGNYEETQDIHVPIPGANLGNEFTLSADGSMLVATTRISYIDSIYIFQSNHQNLWELSYKLASPRNIFSLSLSGDKSTLAVGLIGDPIGVLIYELESGEATLSHEINPVGQLGAVPFAKVSLSLDGKTLAVGNYNDNSARGAFWICRFNDITQNWVSSPKLIPNDVLHLNPANLNSARVGWDLSVSADGLRVLVGGYTEGLNAPFGAVWSYSYDGTNWIQEGSKIKPQDFGVNSILFGYSVSLSADGNLATVSAFADAPQSQGAIYFLEWNGVQWVQQGTRIIPQGAPGTRRVTSISMTPDARYLFSGSLNQGFYQYQNELLQDWVTPSLTFELPDSVNLSESTITLSATSDSPGSINFFILPGGSGSALISQGELHLLSQGTLIIRAIQQSQDYFLAAEAYDTLFINTPSLPTIFLPDSTGIRNSEILMPVFVNDWHDVLGVQFSVAWDNTVATFVGVESFGLPGMDMNAFNLSTTADGYFSFAWSDPTITAQSLPDTTALFYIRFNLSGDFGASTPVAITHHPVSIEVIAADYQNLEVIRIDGVLSVSNEVTLQGTVQYANDEAVQNVTVQLTGDISEETAATDSEGAYSLTFTPGENEESIVLTPLKANDPDLLNGIDVQDVASIRRHILRTELFTSAHQVIAADISNNNTISIQDVILLQALILGVETDMPNGRQWTFVDGEHVFADALIPFPYPQSIEVDFAGLTEEDRFNFTAIKLGDVTLDRDNTQAGRTKGQEVVLEISAPIKQEDGTYEVSVATLGFVDISAYQFTITWDHSKLELLNVIDEKVEGIYGEHKISEGFLTTIWDETNGTSLSLDDQAELFKLRFSALTDTDPGLVDITSQLTAMRMFDNKLNRVEFSVRQATLENKASGSFYPNPFDEEINISFTLREAQVVTIEILNDLGQHIGVIENYYEKGWNEVKIDGSNFVKGLYLFIINIGGKREVSKLIKK